MVKAVHGEVWLGGAWWGSVLSCLASCGVFRRGRAWLCIVRHCVAWLSSLRQGLFWWGNVRCGRALHGEVLYSNPFQGKVSYGLIEVWRRMVLHGTVELCKEFRGLVWLSIVMFCPAGWAKARKVMLRGLVLCGTVLSCPVRLCEVWCFEVWSGIVGWCPVRLCQVRLGSARLSKVWYFEVWFGDVLFGAVGWYGVLYSKVRSYCGVVWCRNVLHSMAKFCPVRHCMVRRATALHCLVRQATVSLRHGIARCGTVGAGLARLAAAGFAKVFYGLVRFCGVALGQELYGDVWSFMVRSCGVLYCGVLRGVVQLCTVILGLVRLRSCEV